MKNIYKTLIVILGILCLIALAIFGGLVGAGSYSYAQQYEFNTTDSVLIKTIERIKNDIPDYRVPEGLSLPDHSDTDGKYHFYIYYRDENKLVHCFIMNRIDNPKRTSIYLDAISNGLSLGNWKVVNSDYNRSENLKIKKEFKERVLNKLQLNYKDDGNGMFIFWK